MKTLIIAAIFASLAVAGCISLPLASGQAQALENGDSGYGRIGVTSPAACLSISGPYDIERGDCLVHASLSDCKVTPSGCVCRIFVLQSDQPECSDEDFGGAPPWTQAL